MGIVTAESIDPDQLRPGLVVRVGRHAAGSVGHTYLLRIVDLGDQEPDGRIRINGDRLTPGGRTVERLDLVVSDTSLYPVPPPPAAAVPALQAPAPAHSGGGNPR